MVLERISELRDRVLNKPVGYTLVWLGLPMMMVQLVNISYNLADSYWLSKYHPYALAVPRQIWPTFMFINAIAQGLMSANLALISQYVGAKLYDEAKRIFTYFFSATLFLNTTAVTIFYLTRKWIFLWLIKVPPEIYEDVLVYSGIISLDILFAAFTFTYTTLFQSIGDTRTPSRIVVFSSLMNVILDPFMIHGLSIGDIEILKPMGVAGAAIATVISRFLGLALFITVVFKKYSVFKPRITFRFDINWIKKCIDIGLPVSIMFATNSLAFMFQNRLVNEFGSSAAAAFSIGFILSDLADAVLWGFTFAVSTMIGQALGAMDFNRAKEVARKSLIYIASGSAAGSTLIYMFRDKLILFFNPEELTFIYANKFIELFSFSIPFFAIFFIGMSVGRGSGHTRFPTLLGIVRLWILRIGLGYLLAFYLDLKLNGVWISMSLSNFVGGALMIPWIINAKWATPVISRGPHAKVSTRFS